MRRSDRKPGVHLSTYRSRTAPDMYVTMPTVEATALFSIVDELLPMELAPVRCGYTLSQEPCDMPFREFVACQIASSGYAVHRFDSAFMP